VAYWYNQRLPQHQSIEKHIQSLPGTPPLWISVITLGEIEYGQRVVSETITVEQQAFIEFTSIRFPRALEIKSTTRVEYGRLRAGLFKRYSPKEKRQPGLRPEQLVDPITAKELGIQENDIWIAAQALEYNLALVTNDKMTRIREVCNDLMVENWAI
jgi:tRNA(fMet)-specific endonuclease VapC